MKSFKVKSLVLLTSVGDIILFFSSYFIVVLLNNQITGSHVILDIRMMEFLPVAASITFVLMLTFDMYKNIFYRTKSDIILSLGLIVVLSLVAEVFISFIFNIFVLRRDILIYAAIYQMITLSGWRIIVWYMRKSMHRKQRILVVGGLEEAKLITEKVLMHQGYIFDIRYIYDIKNGVEGVFELIHRVDHVMLGSEVCSHDSGLISVYCMKYNKNIFLIPDTFSINLNKASFIQVDDLPMFNVSRFGLTLEQKFFKRVFDFVVGAIGLVVAAPIMGVFAILIKLDSPGPVFFKQERITDSGKKFHVIKFRTMVENAEQNTGPVLATDKDPRITKLGGFIRTTRIDEIPQIINVFNGTMSLVGPRPERQFFIDQFVEEVPEFEYRTAVKAGVTGLAQVLGKYSTTFDDKLRYDLMYIKNYSFMLDMKIILKTIKVVLTKEASAGICKGTTFEEIITNHGAMARETKYGYEISNIESRQTNIEEAYREVVK